jgi:molybdopterin-binding protein
VDGRGDQNQPNYGWHFERFYLDCQSILDDSLIMDLLTPRQAAARLGVSYSTIKHWIYLGTLRTRSTAGGHHRVPQSEVDRLLAASGRELASPQAEHSGAIVALSGRNQLRGVVEEVRSDGLLSQIRLRIGNQTLTAVITRDAVDELKLRRGDEALAVIKSTEVMIGRAAAPAAMASRGRQTSRRQARR